MHFSTSELGTNFQISLAVGTLLDSRSCQEDEATENRRYGEGEGEGEERFEAKLHNSIREFER